jgi:hypothetical protein
MYNALGIGLVFGFVFGLVGVIFLIVGLITRSKTQTAKSWPTAQGTIVSTELREHNDDDSESGSSTVLFEPVVMYSYQAMGVACSGKKIGYGTDRLDRSSAQKKINQYPAGSRVTVYYNPENPSEAVLEVNGTGSKVFLILGIVFLVLGVILCCISGMLMFFSSIR